MTLQNHQLPDKNLRRLHTKLRGTNSVTKFHNFTELRHDVRPPPLPEAAVLLELFFTDVVALGFPFSRASPLFEISPLSEQKLDVWSWSLLFSPSSSSSSPLELSLELSTFFNWQFESIRISPDGHYSLFSLFTETGICLKSSSTTKRIKGLFFHICRHFVSGSFAWPCV